jgi:hypothetical protein
MTFYPRTAAMRLVLAAAVLGGGGAAGVIALAGPSLAAPTITTSPSLFTKETSASFTFKAAEGTTVSGFQCSLDNAKYSPCGSTSPGTKSYSGLAAGTHTFEVQALSGQKASPAASFGWTVDLTPPSLSSITRLDPSPTNLASVRWTVTFSEPVTGVGTGSFSLAATV